MAVDPTHQCVQPGTAASQNQSTGVSGAAVQASATESVPMSVDQVGRLDHTASQDYRHGQFAQSALFAGRAANAWARLGDKGSAVRSAELAAMAQARAGDASTGFGDFFQLITGIFSGAPDREVRALERLGSTALMDGQIDLAHNAFYAAVNLCLENGWAERAITMQFNYASRLYATGQDARAAYALRILATPVRSGGRLPDQGGDASAKVSDTARELMAQTVHIQTMLPKRIETMSGHNVETIRSMIAGGLSIASRQFDMEHFGFAAETLERVAALQLAVGINPQAAQAFAVTAYTRLRDQATKTGNTPMAKDANAAIVRLSSGQSSFVDEIGDMAGKVAAGLRGAGEIYSSAGGDGVVRQPSSSREYELRAARDRRMPTAAVGGLPQIEITPVAEPPTATVHEVTMPIANRGALEAYARDDFEAAKVLFVQAGNAHAERGRVPLAIDAFCMSALADAETRKSNTREVADQVLARFTGLTASLSLPDGGADAMKHLGVRAYDLLKAHFVAEVAMASAAEVYRRKGEPALAIGILLESGGRMAMTGAAERATTIFDGAWRMAEFARLDPVESVGRPAAGAFLSAVLNFKGNDGIEGALAQQRANLAGKIKAYTEAKASPAPVQTTPKRVVVVNKPDVASASTLGSSPRLTSGSQANFEAGRYRDAIYNAWPEANRSITSKDVRGAIATMVRAVEAAIKFDPRTLRGENAKEFNLPGALETFKFVADRLPSDSDRSLAFSELERMLRRVAGERGLLLPARTVSRAANDALKLSEDFMRKSDLADEAELVRIRDARLARGGRPVVPAGATETGRGATTGVARVAETTGVAKVTGIPGAEIRLEGAPPRGVEGRPEGVEKGGARDLAGKAKAR